MATVYGHLYLFPYQVIVCLYNILRISLIDKHRLNYSSPCDSRIWIFNEFFRRPFFYYITLKLYIVEFAGRRLPMVSIGKHIKRLVWINWQSSFEYVKIAGQIFHYIRNFSSLSPSTICNNVMSLGWPVIFSYWINYPYRDKFFFRKQTYRT